MSSVQYSIPYDMLPMLSAPSNTPPQTASQNTNFRPAPLRKTSSFMTKVFNTATDNVKRSMPTAHHKKYDLLDDNEFETAPILPVCSTGSSSGFSSSGIGRNTHGFFLKARRKRSDTLTSVTSVESFVSESRSIKSNMSRSTSSSRSSSPERKYTVENDGWVPLGY